MLGDLGADVIKVERPGGDDTRAGAAVDAGGRATYFLSVNRNKRSVALDLAAGDRAAVARLVAGADVVVENFRPGTMDAWASATRSCARVNPRLVYCSITGFGRGAGRRLPGYDL